MQWVVMIVGPTETPDVFGPFRSRDKAERMAERWNEANPASADDPEPWQAMAVVIQPVSRM